ncbi:mitochondrial import inner membrane translocase subunit Tim10 B [Symphorus nematophorus]
MDPDQQLRNLRDFLMVYNRMTEICFQRCTSNFNYRNLTMDEERCVDSCAGKLIRSNHRLMGTYVQLMPRMVQRRMEEMESKAAAAEAAASANVGPPATEVSPGSETPITSSSPPQEASLAAEMPITSSLPPQVSPLLPPPVTDVGPDTGVSVLKPAALDIPLELDAALSKSTTATEVKLSAATALTPATEAVNLPVLNDAAGNGPSYTAGVPQAPVAGSQIKFESSAPVFVPSNPASISADVPVSTIAAPPVSKPTGSQERVPELPPTSGQ